MAEKFDVFLWANEVDEIKNNVSCELFLFNKNYTPFKVRYSARNNIYLIYKNMPIAQLVLNAPLLLLGFGVKYLFFVKAGLSKEYLQGIRQGFSICDRENKVKFKWSHMKNYINIQMELWINVIRRFI